MMEIYILIIAKVYTGSAFTPYLVSFVKSFREKDSESPNIWKNGHKIP